MNIPSNKQTWLWAIALVVTAGHGAAQDRILKRAFARYDKNKDGQVVRKEFPGSDLQYRSMDKNKNGKVTLEEFAKSPVGRRLLALRRRDSKEPRQRVRLVDLEARRLAAVSRFDKNRDGRITKQEWTGAPQSFLELDLDKNGVIDRKDKALGKKIESTPEEQVADFKRKLPSTKYLLGKFDKNKDLMLSKKELGKERLAELFDLGDSNRDGQLEERELNRLVGMVNRAVSERNAGNRNGRARAYAIPFNSWDKNKDGRIDLKEWPQAHRYLFKRVDLNRDAGVTKDEVLRYKRSVEGRDFVERHDLNGDGRVSFEEFGGSRAAFDRADRNMDGVISKRDR